MFGERERERERDEGEGEGRSLLEKSFKKYEGNKRKKEREKVSPQKRGEREREDK